MRHGRLMATCFALAILSADAFGQSWKDKPWLEPQDTAMAIFSPDEYAWRLFLAMNWPSRTDQCGPDTSKKIGDAGTAVWERWPVKEDVFLPAGAKPKSFAELCGAAPPDKKLAPSAQLTVARGETPAPALPAFVQPGGDVSTAADEEVRMNESTLEFIRREGIYSLTKQRAKAAAGEKFLDFPHASKEVKAHWVVLPDAADHTRYHTGSFGGKTYGLAALHITTKDLPKWFWATFEHVDNETRWPAQFPRQFAGWTVPPHDTFACPPGKPDCRELPKGLGLENTRWAFYRLKATQTDWVDLVGEPTHVVNSKIEGGFVQAKSSCISCHSLAMIGENGPSMPFLIVKPEESEGGRIANFVGVVKASDRRPKAGVDPAGKFLQLDFVWSLRNAQPEN